MLAPHTSWKFALVAFVCGAVVMVFEMVGSRILGPYFGTSIYVWTSLIGVILASLSLGYYLGGRVADTRATPERLAMIIFFAALGICWTLIFNRFLLPQLPATPDTYKYFAILASVFAFSPTSVLLGMVTPHLARLQMTGIEGSGSVVGNLSALSTAGSIVGTFAAGFILIPLVGTKSVLVVLVIVLLLTSLLVSHRALRKALGSIGAIFVFGLVGAISLRQSLATQAAVVDVDTTYQRVWIYETVDASSQRNVRTMRINAEQHSSMFLDQDGLVFPYTRYYHLARHFAPGFRNALMIGGGAFSYPKDYLATYPEAVIDVVEIDPGVTALAKTHFNLKDHPRLQIFHEDGRTYLNRNQKKYDVVFGDMFGSYYSIPFQLTTKETVQKLYDALNDQGVVILNTISAIEGDKGRFLQAEYATYKEIFSQVYLFPVIDSQDGHLTQNTMLVALKSLHPADFHSEDPVLNEYLQHLWKKEVEHSTPILTDDFAPVEQYLNRAL